MRSRAFLTALFMVAALMTTAAPLPASASCNPPGNNQDGAWFAGTQRTPAGVPRNIRANIEEYSPFVEIGPATSAWTMLNSGGTRWAQVGWWKPVGQAREAFVQWTDNSNHWFTESFAAGAIGTFPTYQTVYNPAVGSTPSEFVFERNSAVLWRVRPTLWVPATVQAYGEVHNRTDQMPGGVRAPVWLDQVQYTIGGAWTDINSAAGVTDGTLHGVEKTNSHLYKIWDKRCDT
jgi:hypothetical protein